MAKATSSLVVPIIFLVIFALVEQNMGCNDYIVGDVCVHCRERCLRYYPVTRKAECYRNHCLCIGPCPDDRPHKRFQMLNSSKNVKAQILS
ncbi:Defensin-like protein 178 [Arabidopsis thaliana]|uniref:Defensin-like protein 178 n=5 Tax=Arabidopsis TaxID=3701 RepID=DF178_ARATH|nr:low-molecular-weight cysteine-rich 64 [Arabidopsis thaliana]P82778.1 RecName: Full=Defensin-like protein 178; AltName: Full=Low-molecular-weight cysteine-rich protein 64; Short=Protein LCR64; Flags: Precursor [Arabidopsis thaliana]KAG7651585.1 hypothetical protein ISN45_At01g064350 [Arabidopsis thaliana x Arabidopsis arenosa]KAG7659446.1 hypothetical protein ISN44_As01g063230 [Arabidopsis suecica]ABI34019.1 unknown [Arabidopsis thaliana]AEE35483.1 low-molecular-weight cysteine-rich 64 [Arab|eukprot:NP_001031275.1 low-molecular-weight cysteine-rich 64 [Arabidopsis thaliana]